MIIQPLLIVTGFIALIFGANWLVDGASSLAKKYNISDLIIGLTIVAFGTSAPELVVNTFASFKGYSDLILGNIIGSNNFNLFIVLGLSGLILPIKIKSSTAWKEISISLLVTVLVLLLLNDFVFSTGTELNRMDSMILLMLFILFLFYVFNQLKKNQNQNQKAEISRKSALKTWSLIVVGLAGLIIGGQLVIQNSISIATDLGVSQKITGLTIVAVGTSLPELVTSVVAAIKKKSDIAVGNIIGSNIFNLLLILSISGIIKPIPYNPNFNLDIYIIIGGTVFLLLSMLTGERRKLDRWEAAILFVFYVSYTVYLVMQEV